MILDQIAFCLTNKTLAYCKKKSLPLGPKQMFKTLHLTYIFF